MTKAEAIAMLKRIQEPEAWEPQINQAAFEALDMAIEALSQESSEDVISRQAAIDAVKKNTFRLTFAEEQNCEGHVAWSAEAVYSDVMEGALLELPSAQPERTCVNCGRTANNGGWYADGGTRCPIEEHYALPKDGYCHLWEKRNVTDDDYPERREDERPES
jgi:hypothetical protein